MRRLLPFAPLSLIPIVAAACSSSHPVVPIDDAAAPDGGADAATCGGAPCPQSKIEHVVVFVMENKTFDVELGRYCTAPSGTSPTCTDGPSCCEAGPQTEPSGAAAQVLDDALNGNRDPNHGRSCETDEMNGGAMDKYVTSTICGDPGNFAYLDPTVAKPLWDLAATGSIADRYFQAVIGQSSANDMFLARAQWVFDDNVNPANAIATSCDPSSSKTTTGTGQTIADLLAAKGLGLTWYGEGYTAAKQAAPKCAASDPGCPEHLPLYPCVFSPADDPFEYYDTTRDNPAFIADLSQLSTDLAGSTLPAVSFIKPLGYKSDHPGSRDKTSDAIAFITSTVGQILSSPVGASTLVLVTWDEGGGFFDHVKPPATNTADNQPYGTRIPLIALGPFARKNGVSHTTMEHSSIVKFIEWNWLGATGQLQGRDAVVNNLGSVLDASATGVAVPEN